MGKVDDLGESVCYLAKTQERIIRKNRPSVWEMCLGCLNTNKFFKFYVHSGPTLKLFIENSCK
jgi:hypothetical protein